MRVFAYAAGACVRVGGDRTRARTQSRMEITLVFGIPQHPQEAGRQRSSQFTARQN